MRGAVEWIREVHQLSLGNVKLVHYAAVAKCYQDRFAHVITVRALNSVQMLHAFVAVSVMCVSVSCQLFSTGVPRIPTRHSLHSNKTNAVMNVSKLIGPPM